MRVRLQAIVLSLVALVVFGLGVPLALSVADSVRQDLFLDRLTDTERFASLAQRPLLDGQPEQLNGELRRYTEVYGVSAVVVDQDGVPARGSEPVNLADPAIATHVQEALAGRRSAPGTTLLPWRSAPLVLAEPVLVDGEVRGAAVTISPTGPERAQLVWWWVLLAACGAAAFGVALLGALPVVRWILRPVRRLDEATGALVGAVVGGRDVIPVGDGGGPPELRRLSRSFDRMVQSVQEALAAQRAFVADASHQLRNPLTALKLRLANLRGHVDEAADEHRAAAEAEASRLNQILDGLLSLARSEASGGELVAMDLDTAVADRVADWRVVAAAKDVELDTSGVQAGGRVLAPPRGVEVILDALLDNALKFTERGTVVTVSVRLPADGESPDGGGPAPATLTVRDHGPGLRPEDLERATDRFWRSPEHQNVPGSGLGLSIVGQIAERAGGELRLDLPEGGGLRVSVDLPLSAG